MTTLAVRVQCGCGNWVRLTLEVGQNKTRQKNCWKCETPLKAERHGDRIKGYRKPLYSDWEETQVDISEEA